MSDFESLGDESRNPRKYAFLGIVVLATVLVAWIMLDEFGKINPAQRASFFNLIAGATLAVGGFVAITSYMIYTEEMKNKILWIIFILLIAGSVFFIRELITFMTASGLPPALGLGVVYTFIGIFSIAYITKSLLFPSAQFSDSVTSEDESENPLHLGFNIRLLATAGLVVFTFMYVAGTGQAFIQAPSFGLTQFGILDSKLGNAFVSAVVGGVLETAFFFAVLMPFFHSLARRVLESDEIATAVGIIGVTILFVMFHTTVYAYNETALVSVGIFAFINAMLVLGLRDNFQNMAFHFTNNFLVIAFGVTSFLIIV